jgi:anti-sigma factor RsiW
MNCSRVRSNISEYVDGALAPADRYAVEAHIAACEACRTECEAQQRMARLLIEMPRRQLGPDFDAGLQARLRALGPVPRRAGILDRLRSGAPRSWYPVLAPLAVAGLALALWRPMTPPPVQTPHPTPGAASAVSPMASRNSVVKLVREHIRLRDLPESEAVEDALRATSVGDLIE